MSALAFICPMLAALILVYREGQAAGVTALLKRAFDYRRITHKIWYAPILLLRPAILLLSYGIMRWTGVALPAPLFTVPAALGLLLAFMAAALCEELGWSGYAIDPLQDRWGALRAAMLLGSVWAVWHVLPLVQAHRSPAWIAWWFLDTVAARILIVWIYNNTGKSVFAAALYHAVSNLSWQLFPIQGSYFDPRITGLITVLAAAMVAVAWGPRTMTRSRIS